MAKNEITIPVEEYKALLMKEAPTDKDRMIVEGIIQTIKDFSKIVDINSYSADFKGIEFKYENKCLAEILGIIYALDRNRFIQMYKELAGEKTKEDIAKINMAYVRKIKELKENDDE